MVPCAYLRAFEPLDVMPSHDRERWRRYVADGHGISLSAALDEEARIAAVRLITGLAPRSAQSALVRRAGERILICPIELAERHAVALVAFREGVPDQVADAFVPEAQATAALRTVDGLERPPHILESGWGVPLRWFVLFTPDDRHFTDAPEGRGPRVSYLAVAGTAVERLDRALGIVRAHIEDGEEMAESLQELRDWVGSFHPRSIVELDYGSVAGLVDPEELVLDASCAEVWDALESLDRGDAFGAARAYAAVSERWASLRAREHTS